MKIDEFVFLSLFEPELVGTDRAYWWAPVDADNGYIVVWLDETGDQKDHIHTYRYPPDILGK